MRIFKSTALLLFIYTIRVNNKKNCFYIIVFLNNISEGGVICIFFSDGIW